jgi:hypothetical protein
MLDLNKWAPWPPDEVAERLRHARVPWVAVGGWAIDLWLGQKTREHADIEIAILRSDFQYFRRAFQKLDTYAAGSNKIWHLTCEMQPPDDIH